MEFILPNGQVPTQTAATLVAQLAELAGQRFGSSQDATAAVLRTISDILNMRTSWVSDIDFSSNELLIASAHNEPGGCDVEPGGTAPLFDTFSSMAAAIAEPVPLIIQDVRLDKRFAGGRAAKAFPNIGSYVGVPIILSDATVVGTLCASDPDPRPISTQQVELVTVLSRLLATQIERDIELEARVQAE